MVAKQVLLIFVYVSIGILCVKKKILTVESGTSLSNFALTVISPCLIIGSYLRPLNRESLSGLLLAFVLAVVYHAVATAAALLLIPKRADIRYRIERMGAIYSNCGYMAIPLITATVGDIGVFYAVPFISVFTVLLWSAGVMITTGEKKIEPKKMFLNPGFISFVIGLLLYLTQLRLPDMAVQVLNNIMALNTPITMITVGVFLSKISLRSTFTNGRIYYTCALRLLVFPLMMIVLIKVLGITALNAKAPDVVMAVVLACACSAPASTAQFPARFGLESEYGAQIIAVSVLFSVLTLPLLNLITNYWL